MAQLLFHNQFCQDYAEVVQEPVTSYMDACAVQELCCVETRATSFASFASTPCFETHQEPSSLLWEEVAAVKHEGDHVDLPELSTGSAR